MTHEPHSPEYFKTKLYQKEREFKKFEGITEEKLAELSKKVYHKQETAPLKNNPFYKDRLSKYVDILRYLTNPTIHSELKTYDERIAYLIMAADPSLLAFKEFLKTTITSTKTINNEQDPNKKADLIRQRESEIMGLQTRVREKLGFYDTKLIKYEEVFFHKFLVEKEIITEVKQDFITKLLFLTEFITSFNKISDERYEELKRKAEIYTTLTDKENDLFTSAYTCMNQSQTIGLRNIQEQLAFFTLTSDPNLDILRIYEEESLIPEVERRCMEQFGYFNINLVKLEKLYHSRFCQEKKLSPWTL